MTLPISTTIIRNALGYLQCDISALQNYLNILDSNAPQSEKNIAETEVIKFGKNIGKMARTLEERTNMTIPLTGYNNTQLQNKGII